jgi:hexosaminidase
MQNILTSWRNAGTQLEAMIDRTPALHEARPLAVDLSQIGTVGLEALSFLTKDVQPTAAWRDARLAMLEQAAQPAAALEFPIIPSVKELVIAAYELPQLKTMSPAEWRNRVKQLAAQTKSQSK